jgi:hypothetical protein
MARDPKPPPVPTEKRNAGKLRGSVERDEGPALNGKPGYRNSDEVEGTGDARHEDPAGV